MLDTYTITQYISACANNAGVKVVWRKDGIASTNGHTMYLPMINAYTSHANKVKLIHFVKHETCHIKESDFNKLNERKPQGILAFVNNLLEDHRIDYRNDSEYAGDKQNSEEFMRVYASELDVSKITDEAKNYFMPLFAWDLDIRDDLWTRTADPFTLTTPVAKSVYDKLKAGDYDTVLRNIRKIDDKGQAADEVYALAKRIVREVFDVPPEKMEGEKAKKRIKIANENKGEEVDSEGKSEELSVEDVAIDGMPMPNPEHVDTRSMTECVSSASSDEGDSYIPTPADKIEYHNFVTNEGNIHIKHTDKSSEKFINNADRSASLANQIRTKLQIMSRDRYEYGKKRGKLNSGSIYRVGMLDAKGLNERLFKQKIVNKVLDVSVQLLIDASGSMSGNKYTLAASASLVLNNILSNVLKIPTEILAFSDGAKNHQMYILKEFDKPVGDIHLANSFSTVEQYLRDNVDGESLVYGYTRIVKRKEKRKLMIVLSDGSPCGGHDRGNLTKYTKDVIKQIQRSPIELLGIGLVHDTSTWYKSSAIIKDASETSSALLSIITNKILK